MTTRVRASNVPANARTSSAARAETGVGHRVARLDDADAAERLDVAGLDGHDAAVDAVAEDLLEAERHPRRRLSHARHDDPVEGGEVEAGQGELGLGDEDVPLEAQDALHHRDGVHALERCAEDRLGVRTERAPSFLHPVQGEASRQLLSSVPVYSASNASIRRESSSSDIRVGV